MWNCTALTAELPLRIPFRYPENIKYLLLPWRPGKVGLSRRGIWAITQDGDGKPDRSPRPR